MSNYTRCKKWRESEKGREWKKKYRASSEYKEVRVYHVQYALNRGKWYAELRQHLTCSKCGSNKNILLHHIDDKAAAICEAKRWGAEKLKEELDKCIVLCRSCHVSLHNSLRRKEVVCGT